MQDRPDRIELLRGVASLLEAQAATQLEGPARYQARVAVNVVRMVIREMESEEADLQQELDGLSALLDRPGPGPAPAGRMRQRILELNEELSAQIRYGRADRGDFRARVLKHLGEVTVRRLKVVHPRQAELARVELDVSVREGEEE